MKIIFNSFLLLLILLTSNSLYSQIGIGTTLPDASSVLDISSNSKGLLMPRLTTVQRDAISLPATGLMIYNTTLSDGQLNDGTPAVPNWSGIKGQNGPHSVTEGGSVSATSTSNVLVPGMTLSPPSGSYLVLFNGQMSSSNIQAFSSSQAVIDVKSLYDALIAVATTDGSHGIVFGNGEILLPGVYDVGANAPSISGTLTLAGGTATANPLFIIRGTGAFTTAALANVILTGNAKPENIFWVTDGAPTLGAGTTMSGTLIHGSAAAGAPGMGANSTLDGRLFTTLGAASVAAGCTLTAPGGIDPFSLGVLSTFAMWSSNGAISSDISSTINGDVGTGAGATTGMLGTVNGTIYGAGTTGITNSPTDSNFSIYKNTVEVVNSNRVINVASAVVSLQAMVTVATGDTIEIHWNVVDGEVVLENRILSVIRAGY